MIRGLTVALALSACGCMTTTQHLESDVLAYRGNRDEVLALETDLSSDDFEERWQLASACLELVDRPGSPDDDKLDWAKRALQHADRALALEPKRVEGYYYRAIALGRVLEHSSLAPVSKIAELEEAGVQARELDPAFRCAGPLRLLALLYLKAPPWPLGPELAGEEDVIQSLFDEALSYHPECPALRADYAEFLLELDRNEECNEQCQLARRFLDEGKVSERTRDWEIVLLRQRLRELLERLGG